MLKIRKRTAVLLKITLAILVFYLIYKQVISRSNIEEIQSEFSDNLKRDNLHYLILCLLLMPLNWFLESIKWRSLVMEFQELSFIESFKAIMAGLSVGVITPQRIGEYGGRVLVLDSQNRVKGILATFLCSLAQNGVNVVFGIIGIFFLNKRLDLVSEYWIIFLVISVLAVTSLLYVMYRNTSIVKRVVQKYIKVKWLRDGIYKLVYLKEISVSLHFKVLLYSILRFAVYLMQYIFILWFFGIDMSLFEGFTGVSSIYLIQSGIPLPPIVDVAARAELAYLIWGMYSENVLGILSATYGLWIINLILPSLLGLFYVIKMNLSNSSD